VDIQKSKLSFSWVAEHVNEGLACTWPANVSALCSGPAYHFCPPPSFPPYLPGPPPTAAPRRVTALGSPVQLIIEIGHVGGVPPRRRSILLLLTLLPPLQITMPDDDADMEEADALNHTTKRVAAVAGTTAQQERGGRRCGRGGRWLHPARNPALMPFHYPLLVDFLLCSS
jgi:hypothetical protein